ncbi:MAG: ribonuclease E inhibitor RraB [Gemmatimonadaceae bacterium]
MSDAHADDLLRQQLERTRATWQALVDHGVNDATKLCLDFFFEAPSYARAIELKEFLGRMTDYDVSVAADADEWMVRGTTQATTVALPTLERWVAWMSTAGLQFDCVFDGWGAELP